MMMRRTPPPQPYGPRRLGLPEARVIGLVPPSSVGTALNRWLGVHDAEESTLTGYRGYVRRCIEPGWNDVGGLGLIACSASPRPSCSSPPLPDEGRTGDSSTGWRAATSTHIALVIDALERATMDRLGPGERAGPRRGPVRLIAET